MCLRFTKVELAWVPRLREQFQARNIELAVVQIALDRRHVSREKSPILMDGVSGEHALAIRAVLGDQRHDLAFGILEPRTRRPDLIEQSVLRVHVTNEWAHPREGFFGLPDDLFDLGNRHEIWPGDDRCDRNDHTALRVETGHFKIHPDESGSGSHPCYLSLIVRSALACFLGFGVTLVLFHGAACSSGPENNRFMNNGGAGGTSGAAGVSGAGGTNVDIVGGGDGGFNPDAACGLESFVAKTDPIHLYLVVDRSGSMSEIVGGQEKFTALRSALVDLVGQIGFRSEIGLAVYPYQPQNNACQAGREMIAMKPGDPRSFFDQGLRGPVTSDLYSNLLISPLGGTPTGPTLKALQPTLEALGKNTFVLLATDGGPNCNGNISCTAAQCIPNIENAQDCPSTVNCCDPSLDPRFSPENCLDSNGSLTAISQLAAAGVKTLVLGIPGSAPYKSLLNTMAVAGGAPRDGDTRYYAADSLDELSSLLGQIGSEVLISCTISLDKAPSDASLVNVYFDSTLVKSSESAGWTWTNSTTIQLHGAACDSLLSGSVGNVYILVGCPTEIQ